jgi:hypothetical protein
MSCSFPRCHSDDVITWLGHQLCDKHWNWVCGQKKEKALETLGVTKEAGDLSTPALPEEKKDIPVVKRGRKRIEIPEAKELLASGMKIKAIAEKLKLPYQKVYHYLKGISGKTT